MTQIISLFNKNTIKGLKLSKYLNVEISRFIIIKIEIFDRLGIICWSQHPTRYVIF